MSKLLAAMAVLKATLVAASFACSRGEILPVILISALFSLANPAANPASKTAQRDGVVVSGNHD